MSGTLVIWRSAGSAGPKPASNPASSQIPCVKARNILSGTVILKNELYFFGGETAKKEANKLMFSFNLNDKKWKQKPSLNIGRHGTNAAVLNNKIYIASGSGNQGGGPELTSIEIYK